HPVRVDPLCAHALARLLDLVGDVAHDHRVRHREGVHVEDGVDDLLLERAPLVLGTPRLEPFRTSARSAARLANSPTDFANSSSSAGNSFSFTSTTLTAADPPRPRSSSRRWSSAKRNGTECVSPARIPTTAASISGRTVLSPTMNW